MILFDIFDTCAKKFKDNHIIPVFSTIVPFNINMWNNHRLNIGATKELRYTSYYTDMQYFLNSTIIHTNEHICKLNQDNDVITPNLAKFHISSRGTKQGYRYNYKGMDDGCHPNSLDCDLGKGVVQNWVNEILKAQKDNRHKHSCEKAIKHIWGFY